jgi:hypothetical protein
LSGVTTIAAPVRVKVADDRQLKRSDEVCGCKWIFAHGYEFSTNFKLLQYWERIVVSAQSN